MSKKYFMVAVSLLNIAGYIAVIAINALANILPINGKNTAELSDKYPSLFVPSGLTFAIWGVIYILLLIFSIYQAIEGLKREASEDSFVEKIGVWFFITCLANCGWIFAWHYEKVLLSVCIMILLMVSLIIIYVRLGVGISIISTKEKLMVHFPFSVYTGWVSIALIANISVLMVDLKWNFFGLPDVFWAAVFIIIGALIAVIVILKRNDLVFSLVVIWAFTGIIIKRTSSDPQSSITVVIAAIVSIVIILACMVFRFRKWLEF